MSPAEEDYCNLRRQVSCSPGHNPQITCSSASTPWEWSLGSINEEDWDSTAAATSFELNRLNPSFWRFIRLLPFFLADPGSALRHSSDSPFKADLRASMRLIDFVLQKLTTIFINGVSFEITHMLLTRLRFFISWQRFESLRRESNTECSLAESECHIAQKQWLDVLLDPKQGKRFEFWADRWSRDYSKVIETLEPSFSPSLQPTRGIEVKLAVFNGKTARFCQTDADRRYLQLLLRAWFLPQYDLGTTRTILRATSIFERGKSLGRLLRGICRPDWVGSLSVYIGLLFLGLLVVFLPWFVTPSQVQYVSRLLDILPWVGLTWIILISCGVFCWGNIVLSPHVPRLAAATLVGLFGLAISDLPWKFSIQGFSQAPALSVGLCVLSILLVLGYFSWEIGSSGASRSEVIRRSSVLLLIGLSQALLFSTVFTLFLAGPLYRPELDSNVIKALETAGTCALFSVDTRFGSFYPSLAALYGFGSLAGGTLLQLLWQERRITSTDVVPT